MSRYNNWVKVDYRALVKKKLDDGCIICGENTHFKLCVHHIDGDKWNNDRANLEVLCYNCHCTRHLRWNNKQKRWNYVSSELTERDLVLRLDEKFCKKKKMHKTEPDYII